ncbi:MAG: glycosyltransferase family 9 protein [Ignavibacteriaceae bacterium]
MENKNIHVIQTASIHELISEIKKCSIFISNDSGPLYLANLLNKPTFSIYGPTNPEYSLPFGKYHKFIQKKISCSPNGAQYCFTHAGLYCPSYECMHQLSVDEVGSSIKKYLIEIGLEPAKEFVN